MCSKKDQQEAKRKAKEATASRKPTTTGFNLFGNGATSNGDAGPSNAEVGDDVEDVYRAEMDNLKCILYFHGGTTPAYEYVADNMCLTMLLGQAATISVVLIRKGTRCNGWRARFTGVCWLSTIG